MLQIAGSLPSSQRRSKSSPALHAERPAKQALGHRSPAASSSLRRSSGALKAISQEQLSKGKKVGAVVVEVTGDVCSICLEVLVDEGGFVFPCGHDHRLHYKCAMQFLRVTSSLPLADGSPGLLPKELSRSLDYSFRAISTIRDVLRNAPQAFRERICCPLCRKAWPAEDAAALETVVNQLRDCRAREQGENARKMFEALSRIADRLEHSEETQRARTTKGLISLQSNLHSASSFLAHRKGGDLLLSSILCFLRCQRVSNLSMTSAVCNRVCHNGTKLRVPCVALSKLRAAVFHVSAPDVISLQVAVSAYSGKATTGLEVVAFAKWLGQSMYLRELTLSGLQWEKLDPEASYLRTSLPSLQLRYLDLSSNSLLDVSCANLAKALLSQPSSLEFLEVILLNFNYLTEASMEAVLQLGAKSGRGICEWGFRHNQLGDKGCQLISKQLDDLKQNIGSRPSRPASLDLRRNGIGPLGCRDFASVLESMVVARLGCNPLHDIGVQLIVPGLSGARRLKILDLGHVQVGDAGCIALARYLSGLPSLEELLLAGNEMSCLGAGALADAWAWVSSLRHVDLSHNLIGSYGVQAIAAELPFWKQSPFRLSLSGVDCEEAGARALKFALEKHPRRGQGWVIELQNNRFANMVVINEIQRLLED